LSSLALPLRVFEYWLMVYRRVWRGTAITSIVNPVFYLGALGVGLGTLVNKSSGSSLGIPYIDFVAPGMLTLQCSRPRSEFETSCSAINSG